MFRTSLVAALVASAGAAAQSTENLVSNLAAPAGLGATIGPGAGVQQKAVGWVGNYSYSVGLAQVTLSLDFTGGATGVSASGRGRVRHRRC